MSLTSQDIIRFWSKVNIKAPDECWIWVASRAGRYSCEYGQFGLNGKTEQAHRVAWMIDNGPIPETFEGKPACILHSCDNPGCVNPSHLFLGNQKINAVDSVNKGRRSFPHPWVGLRNKKLKGENHPKTHLTDNQVKQIKQLLKEGNLTQKEIGERFGIAKQTVFCIKAGITWSHINKEES